MAKKSIKQRKADFLQAYDENNSILYRALKQSNVKKSEYDAWIEKDTDFKEEVEMLDLKAVAQVEERMFEIIHNKSFIDDQLIKFYLTSKGGYSTPKDVKKTKDEYTIDFGK